MPLSAFQSRLFRPGVLISCLLEIIYNPRRSTATTFCQTYFYGQPCRLVSSGSFLMRMSQPLEVGGLMLGPKSPVPRIARLQPGTLEMIETQEHQHMM